jgi:hypothetical protein
MNKLLLSFLAFVCLGVVTPARAADSTTSSSTPAERNAALFASGASVRVNDVYIYNGGRYHHRRIVGYHRERVVFYRDGVRFVEYRRVPVYTYW